MKLWYIWVVIITIICLVSGFTQSTVLSKINLMFAGCFIEYLTVKLFGR